MTQSRIHTGRPRVRFLRRLLQPDPAHIPPLDDLAESDRCVACGETIEPEDDEVQVHGQRAHTRCTVYRRRRRTRPRR